VNDRIYGRRDRAVSLILAQRAKPEFRTDLRGFGPADGGVAEREFSGLEASTDSTRPPVVEETRTKCT